MAGWRELKRSARDLVHTTFEVPSYYFSGSGVVGVPVSVRLHTKFDALGDLRNAGWADMSAIKPQIVFHIADAPENGSMVWVAANEIYFVSMVQEPDDQYITANVVLMTPTQASKVEFNFPPDG